MNGEDLREEIGRYAHRAKHGWISCSVAVCPRCAKQPETFKRHGVRPRWFIVLVGGMLCAVASYLTRWKCPLCERTFPLYPAFAVPFKRHVLPFIAARCQAYVEDAAVSYRKGVEGFLEDGKKISHEDGGGGKELAHTTLYRWVTTLGRLAELLRKGVDLIKQKDPATGLVRELGGLRIAVNKSRSSGREIILRRCAEVLAAGRAYCPLFGAELFPDLATACGWR